MSDLERSLPDGWQWVALSSVCHEIYRYPSFYGMEHLSRGVPVIRVEHINDRGEISTDWSDYWFVSQDVSQQFPRTVLNEGDLVFSVRGTIGKVGLVRSPHIGSQISPNAIRIAPTKEVLPEFLWLYLRTLKGTDEAVKDNTVTVSTVRASDITTLPIPLPPLEEQKRIAAVIEAQLAEVEASRQALQAQLAAAQDLAAACLREVFESEEAKGWEKIKLGNLVQSYRNGFGRRPEGKESGAIVLRIADVSSGKVDLSDPRRGEMSPQELITYGLQQGDLLFIRVNGSKNIVGRCILVKETDQPLAFNDHLIRVRLNVGVNPEYLQLFCNTPHVRTHIEEAASTSAGQLTINQDTIASIEMPLPSTRVQQQIVEFTNNKLNEIEAITEALREQLEVLEKIPAEILRAAFRGEL